MLGPNQFGSKKNVGSNKFGSKNVRSKKNWVQYILVKKMGQQKSWVQTNFCSKNSRWSLKFLNPKRFLVEKNVGSKSVGSQKIWAEKILSPKKLGKKKVLANKRINIIKAIRIKQQSLEEHFFPLLLFVVGCGSVVLWRMRLAAAPYLLLI